MARSRGLPAWALSLLLHASLVTVLVLFVQVARRGGQLEAARGTGIVLTRNVEGKAEYFSDSDNLDSSESDPSSMSAESALPTEQQLPLDLPGMLPEQAPPDIGDHVADSMPSTSGLASGAPAPRGQIGGNEARTSIFGAEGVGNKFIYVFDRSKSMLAYEGRPLAAAKQELIASLNDLDEMQQFQILFYNDSQIPTVFNPSHPRPPKMLFADERNRRLAQRFVKGVVALGGTDHMIALRYALNLQPDVVFFLTDATDPQLTVSELDEIRKRNSRAGSTIHAIEFGTGPRQGGISFLYRLARQNGGKYVYVDVTRLPVDP